MLPEPFNRTISFPTLSFSFLNPDLKTKPKVISPKADIITWPRSLIFQVHSGSLPYLITSRLFKKSNDRIVRYDPKNMLLMVGWMKKVMSPKPKVEHV